MTHHLSQMHPFVFDKCDIISYSAHHEMSPCQS